MQAVALKRLPDFGDACAAAPNHDRLEFGISSPLILSRVIDNDRQCLGLIPFSVRGRRLASMALKKKSNLSNIIS